MRVTSEQKRRIATALTWAAHVIRGGKAPIFKLDAPRSLPALARTSNAQRVPHGFNGDEPFTPTELTSTYHGASDCHELTITMAPTALSQVKRISNIRLPLDQAFEFFPGLSDWFASAEGGFTAPPPEGVPERAVIVSKEEHRASESWGAW